MSTVFETTRLRIRRPTTSPEDVDLLFNLWTDPQVMADVGFPEGLTITREEVKCQVAGWNSSPDNDRLVAALKESGQLIGECKLGKPDTDGTCETDVKLLPRFWGRGLGTEIKQGLVDYLFTHTDCTAVRATPNRNNIASQKMQEAVGGKVVDQGVYHFPKPLRSQTIDVPYLVYVVTREEWQRRRC
ncbi:MAG: GNAT family protein [bacterium]